MRTATVKEDEAGKKEALSAQNVDSSTKWAYTALMNHTERIFEFLLAVNTLEKQMNRLRSVYMEEIGLNGAELLPLLLLYSHPEGLRPDEFVHLTRTDKAQISRSLKNLSRTGWIEKEAPGVYRARYKLTSKGCALMEHVAEQSAGVFKKAHSAVGDEEWNAFYDFAQALSEEIEEMVSARKARRAELSHSFEDRIRTAQSGQMRADKTTEEEMK